MKHPLHPVIVHFPVACWSLATCGDVLGMLMEAEFHRAVAVLHSIGLLSGIIAMLAGLVDFAKIPDDSPALPIAHQHILLACGAWFVYGASLLLRVDSGTLIAPGALQVSLSALGLALLLAAGFAGGTLVYSHGVGVQRTPRQKRLAVTGHSSQSQNRR